MLCQNHLLGALGLSRDSVVVGERKIGYDAGPGPVWREEAGQRTWRDAAVFNGGMGQEESASVRGRSYSVVCGRIVSLS
jgi:hypothetical protein